MKATEPRSANFLFEIISFFNYQIVPVCGAGEMVQQLRALPALAEGVDQVPSVT